MGSSMDFRGTNETYAVILLSADSADAIEIIYLRGILSSSHRPPGLFMIFTFASCAMFLKVVVV
jgi:hypothetical protein